MGLPWVRLDCTFAMDPFVFKLSDRAFRLHVAVLCTTASNGHTDLFIPDVTAEREARFIQRRQPHKLIDEVVDAQVWTRLEGGGYVADGWNVRIGGKPERRALIDPVVRESVYERDGYRCLMCGATEPLSLDHIIPWSTGGDDTYDNLRTLCIPCNSRRGAARFDDETLRNGAQSA